VIPSVIGGGVRVLKQQAKNHFPAQIFLALETNVCILRNANSFRMRGGERARAARGGSDRN
jgi:hypothetical protein